MSPGNDHIDALLCSHHTSVWSEGQGKRCVECGAYLGLTESAEPKALKYDAEKPRVDLVPYPLIVGAARAFGFGVGKYAAFNFREGEGLKTSRNLARATVNHLLVWLHAGSEEKEIDDESGLSHLDHAAASLGMLMDTVERIKAGHLPASADDRWKEKTK